MLQRIYPALLALAGGASLGCGAIWDPCDFKENQCDQACIAEDQGSGCRLLHRPDEPGTEAGVITKLGSCGGNKAAMKMPAPFFTVRTRRADGVMVQDPVPNQCQPFDIVWNVCNDGGLELSPSQSPHTVTIKETVPAGGNPGIDMTIPKSFEGNLKPCECVLEFFAFPVGLQCNQPVVSQNQIVLSSSVSGALQEMFHIEGPMFTGN